MWEDWDYSESEDMNVFFHEKCDCIENAVENLFWYDKTLIQRKFYDGWTYAKMNQYYNISLNSLIKDVHAAVEKIKLECQ